MQTSHLSWIIRSAFCSKRIFVTDLVKVFFWGFLNIARTWRLFKMTMQSIRLYPKTRLFLYLLNLPIEKHTRTTAACELCWCCSPSTFRTHYALMVAKQVPRTLGLPHLSRHTGIKIRSTWQVLDKHAPSHKPKTLKWSSWVFPKLMVPPNHPFKNRVFHEIFNHPFWDTHIFGKHPYGTLRSPDDVPSHSPRAVLEKHLPQVLNRLSPGTPRGRLKRGLFFAVKDV